VTYNSYRVIRTNTSDVGFGGEASVTSWVVLVGKLRVTSWVVLVGKLQSNVVGCSGGEAIDGVRCVLRLAVSLRILLGIRGGIQNIPDSCRHLYRGCCSAKHR
jgi:hypothetical protein